MTIPREILQKIRRIQIRTSHRVDELLAGTWHSAFKGRGIEFEEVRPYQAGDDVRAIDWNVTARSDEPYIKLFREERELSVQLLVDLSGSLQFGSTSQVKRDLVAELGATLAFSAIKNNDRVGLTLFTNDIEQHIPPRKGSRHVLRLIRELLYFEPIGQGTSIKKVLEHLNRMHKRRTVVFLVSDFLDSGFEKTLRVATRKHELIPVVVSDPREESLPNIGLMKIVDSETGQPVWIDTASRKVRQAFAEQAADRRERRISMFRKYRLNPIWINTGSDYIEPLQRYFLHRESGARV